MIIEHEICGSGESLLLIHGCNVNMSMYDSFMPAISQFYQAIRYNLPGIGHSDYPKDTDLTIWRQAEIAKNLLEKLDIQKTHVMGVSFGGWIALALAIQFPGLVDKLILAATPSFEPWRIREEDIPTLKTALNQELDIKQKSQAHTKIFYSKIDAGQYPGYFSHLEAGIANQNICQEVVDEQIKSAANFNCIQQLQQMDHSTLVLFASHDKLVSPSSAKQLSSIIPYAKIIEIVAGGHLFIDEFPNKCARVIQKFISKGII